MLFLAIGCISLRQMIVKLSLVLTEALVVSLVSAIRKLCRPILQQCIICGQLL